MDTKTIAFILVGVLVGAAVGVGAGYLIWNDSSDGEETYSFYLYFGTDDDSRNGWYSADATNTNDAFSKVMSNAGFAWEKSSYGYLSLIDGVGVNGGWSLWTYIYALTDQDAAEASILYPMDNGYGGYDGSNGWRTMMGYDQGDTLKLSQFESKIYFFAPYNADYSAPNPVEFDGWMNSGPFATA